MTDHDEQLNLDELADTRTFGEWVNDLPEDPDHEPVDWEEDRE